MKIFLALCKKALVVGMVLLFGYAIFQLGSIDLDKTQDLAPEPYQEDVVITVKNCDEFGEKEKIETYCKKDDGIYYKEYTSEYSFSEEKVSEDPENFKITNYTSGLLIASDKESVYIGKSKIKIYPQGDIVYWWYRERDASIYLSDDSKLYYFSIYKGVKSVSIDSAKLEMMIIGRGESYFKDGNMVYDSELDAVNADAESFVSIGYQYAKDKYGVYYYNKKIEGADPVTFTYFAEDLNDVDYMGFAYYAKDAKSVYYKGIIIPEANVTEFNVITINKYYSEYARDDKNVYFEGEIIKGADPQTFVFLDKEHLYARDNKHIYFEASVIENADPVTFTLLSAVNPNSYVNYNCSDKHITEYPYALDKTQVYYKNMPVQGADRATFKVMVAGYAQDARHVFWNGELQNGFDVETFNPSCEERI